jgi:type I restriction enzyme, S subunit
VSSKKSTLYAVGADTFLASIPAHWRVQRLKRLVDIHNGRDFKDFEVDEGYPVIGSGGAFAKASDFMYKGESVLLGRKGTINRPLYVNEPFWVVDTMFYTIMKRGTCAKFLYYSATTIPFDLYSTNTALPSMTQVDLVAIAFAVPPFAEQIRIAKFLDRETGKIDALIAEQEKLLTILAEKRRATITHAVTRGMTSNVPLRASGLSWSDKIPSHWTVIRLGQLFSQVNDSGDRSLPILSVSIHHGVSDKELTDDEMDRKVSRGDDPEKYKRVAVDDLVYNMMRAWQGGFGTVAIAGMVSPAYVIARRKRGDVATRFIELLLRTPNGIQEMKRYSRGVTDFRLRLYWNEFKNIAVALPPLDEQQLIFRACEELSQNMETLEREVVLAIGLLKERRSALISAAVTGKIDVRDYVAAEEPAADITPLA